MSPHVPGLVDLELLSDVARLGSLSAAAAAHGISQPAVSARMRRTEQLVGVPLLRRGPSGSTLTAAGSLLAQWGTDVLRAAEALDAGVASLREQRDVRLRVAASLTIAEHLLPLWLVVLSREHPETAVSLSAMNSADVARAVLGEGVELGFVEGPNLPPGLDGEVVRHDKLQVVVAPDHRWARRRSPVTGQELCQCRLVHREPTSGTRAALEAALADHGEMAAPLLELSSTLAVLAAVRQGAGPAVVSGLAAHEDVRAQRLVVVKTTGIDLERSLRAVWPHGQHPAGPARSLLAIAQRRATLQPH